MGEIEAFTYPIAEPGSQEFSDAIQGRHQYQFAGSLAFLTSSHAAIIGMADRLPDAMRPHVDAAQHELSPLRAQVSASGWTGQIAFIFPESEAFNELEQRLLLASLGIREAPPKNAVISSSIRFPLNEWPEWQAWLDAAGADWSPMSGFNPDDPWNGDVDEQALVALPGWQRPGPNGFLLRNTQKDGVRFFLQRRGRALLADKMGGGKTVQAIVGASALHSGRTLIVAPAGVKSVWERELLGWGVATKNVIHILSGSDDRPGPDDQWLICNYEQIAIKDESFSCQDQQEFNIVKSLLVEHGVIDGQDIVDDAKVEAAGSADAGRGVRKKYRIVIKAKPDDTGFGAIIPDAAAQAMANALPGKRYATWRRFVARRNGELLTALLDWQPGIVIFDEAHRLKNGAASRTRSAIRLSREAIAGCFLLSGTPLVNNTAEPATLLHVMNPGAYQELRDKRISVERMRGLLYPVTLRRSLEEMGHELPPLIEQVIDIDGHSEVGNRADDMFEDYTILDAIRITGESAIRSRSRDLGEDEEAMPVWKNGDVERNQIIESAWHMGPAKSKHHCPIENHTGVTLAAMLRAKLSQSKAKSPQVLDIVEDVLENKGCVVIFTLYKDGMAHLIEQVGKRWRVAKISGRVPPGPKRDAITNNFQAGKIDCLVVSLKAGGEGIDLWRASTCIMLDIPDTAHAVLQGVGRLRRPGQKGDHVHVIHCVSDNPIDRFLIELCKTKAHLSGQVLGETVQIMETAQGDLECRGLLPVDVDDDVPADDSEDSNNQISKKAKERRGHGVITKTFSEEREAEVTEHRSEPEVTDPSSESEVTEPGSEPEVTDLRSESEVTDPSSEPEVTEHGSEPEVTEHGSEVEVTDLRSESEVTEHRSEPEVTDPSSEPEVTEHGEVVTIGKKKRPAAQWEIRHPDKVKQQTAARAKRYREKHPEKHKEGMKTYRQEHKVESRAYMQEYRKDNEDLKARHREYMRAWRAKQKASA
jgi:superfamily II DNA or RNA helicase